MLANAGAAISASASQKVNRHSISRQYDKSSVNQAAGPSMASGTGLINASSRGSMATVTGNYINEFKAKYRESNRKNSQVVVAPVS